MIKKGLHYVEKMKLIKKGLYYVEEMKSLGSAEIKKIYEKLIIFKNKLIRKNRINNRIKNDLDDYNGIKDMRYLYNDQDIYNGINDIKHLFNGIAFNKNEDKDIKRNAYYAEQIKKIKTTYKELSFK